MADAVHFEILEFEDGFLFRRSTAGKSADASLQLGESKRLGEVVIGAGIEAANAILHAVFGSKEEDGSAMAETTEIAHDLDSIAAGKHYVENEEIERLGLGEIKAVFARGSGADGMIVGLEPVFKCLREFRFILDDKNAHETNVKLSFLTLVSGKIQDDRRSACRAYPSSQKEFRISSAGCECCLSESGGECSLRVAHKK
jgi:hypothetical protein